MTSRVYFLTLLLNRSRVKGHLGVLDFLKFLKNSHFIHITLMYYHGSWQTCSVGTDHGYGYGYGYEAMGMGTGTGSRPWVWVRVRVRDHGYGYGYGYDM